MKIFLSRIMKGNFKVMLDNEQEIFCDSKGNSTVRWISNQLMI
jgi:hypothetical protein